MSSNGWTTDDLRRIGGSTELRLASYRRDGTLRRYIVMWTVAAGDSVYVRSAHGPDNPWFRRDVDFVRLAADDPMHTDVDAAYHAKYDRYGRLVDTVTGASASHTTLRLDPRD
jgi:hypothetical protein